MLTVACCLWEPNCNSQEFSRCYTDEWAIKLYNGFKRHLTRPFRFVVFSDRPRRFYNGIEMMRLRTMIPGYGCLIEPFVLNEPMIVCGLDMIVLRNIDHYADYCMTAELMAFPRNPYKLDQLINPIGLIPAGHKWVFDKWHGENDMDYLRKWPCAFVDDLWPGEMLSCKFNKVRTLGTQDARIVYFHGPPKPHELLHLDWVKQNWV